MSLMFANPISGDACESVVPAIPATGRPDRADRVRTVSAPTVGADHSPANTAPAREGVAPEVLKQVRQVQDDLDAVLAGLVSASRSLAILGEQPAGSWARRASRELANIPAFDGDFLDRAQVDLWCGAIDRLTSLVEEAYPSPGGIRLAISRRDVAKAMGVAVSEDVWPRAVSVREVAERCQRLSCEGIWRHLVSTYVTAEGLAAAEEAVCERFVHQYLRAAWHTAERIRQPVWRGGRLVLELPVTTERLGSRGPTLTWSSRDDLVRRFGILRDAISLVDSACAMQIQDAASALADRYVPIQSRERLSYGLVQVITYQTKIEILLPEAVALQLMARVQRAVQREQE